MTKPKTNGAVIVAAGRGTRMGAGTDKLLLEAAGAPILAHTWGRFDRHPDVSFVVVVVREDLQERCEQIAAGLGLTKPYRFVVGGAERQDSVWSGLESLPAEVGWVAIQDAARPCTSPALIGDVLEAARRTGAAVAAQQVTDTLKESGDGRTISRTVDRSRLWSVQTPQAFGVDVIRGAIAEARRRGLTLTDDTAACELVGQAVELVASRSPNPKVTTPADLPYVEWLLRAGVGGC